MRHSALPVAVEQTIAALPHDAHPMGTILTGLAALSTCHPEQNPALAGQGVYASKEVQDKQVWWVGVGGVEGGVGVAGSMGGLGVGG
jgi:citrate synthase